MKKLPFAHHISVCRGGRLEDEEEGEDMVVQKRVGRLEHHWYLCNWATTFERSDANIKGPGFSAESIRKGAAFAIGGSDPDMVVRIQPTAARRRLLGSARPHRSLIQCTHAGSLQRHALLLCHGLPIRAPQLRATILEAGAYTCSECAGRCACIAGGTK